MNRNATEKGIRALQQSNFIEPQNEEDWNVILEQEFITCLNPNEKFTISGTLKLEELDLPMYTNIEMQVKLDLGYIHDKQNTFHNIQCRNFNIQLTERH